MATDQNYLMQIPRSDMTSVMENTNQVGSVQEENGDIPISQIDMTGDLGGGGNFTSPLSYPMVLPNSPTFTVPANPLLPPEYSEVLDYNALQYLNGIFRTQIGRYVRVQ